jgi:hypothetical protein
MGPQILYLGRYAIQRNCGRWSYSSLRWNLQCDGRIDSMESRKPINAEMGVEVSRGRHPNAALALANLGGGDLNILL